MGYGQASGSTAYIPNMAPTLEQMARSLVESGEYRVTGRLGAQAEYHPPDDIPKVIAADVETTGTTPDSDKIMELRICLFEYEPSERADLQSPRFMGMA